jgi:hypothetical protein
MLKKRVYAAYRTGGIQVILGDKRNGYEAQLIRRKCTPLELRVRDDYKQGTSCIIAAGSSRQTFRSKTFAAGMNSIRFHNHKNQLKYAEAEVLDLAEVVCCLFVVSDVRINKQFLY